MRSAKGWMVCWMAVAIGILVLGAPPQASATFQLALQEDAGAITPVATGASFGPLTFTGTFGDYSLSFFGATATNTAIGSDLLSSVTSLTSLVAATHTLSLYVSNQDYTLPMGPVLNMRSGMGGAYGSTPGFTGAATFQAWADAGNGLRAIPGTFTNGLQTANPPSGNAVTFDTGVDPNGHFTRGAGPFSLTDRTSITTTGLGGVNYSNRVRVMPVPEPNATLIMSVIGVLGLFLGMRRRKS